MYNEVGCQAHCNLALLVGFAKERGKPVSFWISISQFDLSNRILLKKRTMDGDISIKFFNPRKNRFEVQAKSSAGKKCHQSTEKMEWRYCYFPLSFSPFHFQLTKFSPQLSFKHRNLNQQISLSRSPSCCWIVSIKKLQFQGRDSQ